MFCIESEGRCEHNSRVNALVTAVFLTNGIKWWSDEILYTKGQRSTLPWHQKHLIYDLFNGVTEVWELEKASFNLFFIS